MAQREERLGGHRRGPSVQHLGMVCGHARLAKREHQQRPVVGVPGRRPSVQGARDRDVGDLEGEQLGVDLGPLADLIDGLEPDPEEADLLLGLGGLTDREDTDDVLGVERDAVVPDADRLGVDVGAEGMSLSVLGVLEQLDQEVSGVGVDPSGQDLFRVGLRQRAGQGA